MLENILRYQEIESGLISEENELLKSKDREKAAEIQQTLKNQHSRLISLENQAAKVNDSYKKATEKYNEFLKKLESLEKEMDSADQSKTAIYEKAYKDFSAVANTLEKDIANIYTLIQQISREYEEIIKKSKTEREKFDKYKASYAKLKAEKEPKIADAKQKLVEQAKLIDSKLMSKYTQKRDSKMFPVFVALVSNKCGGCRMEISASKLGQMNTNQYGVIECENCGRYIYKK